MKKVLVLLLLHCASFNAQSLLVNNASQWPIDLLFTVRGTQATRTVVQPNAVVEIADLAPFLGDKEVLLIEQIAVQGHGIIKGYASPSKDITSKVASFIVSNKENMAKNDLIITVNTTAPQWGAPRGDWSISLSAGRIESPYTLKQLYDNPNLFFPRLKGQKYSRKQKDIPRYILNIPGFHTPTQVELAQKKEQLIGQLKRITAAHKDDTAEQAQMKQSVEHTIIPRIKKAYSQLLKKYGYEA